MRGRIPNGAEQHDGDIETVADVREVGRWVLAVRSNVRKTYGLAGAATGSSARMYLRLGYP